MDAAFSVKLTTTGVVDNEYGDAQGSGHTGWTLPTIAGDEHLNDMVQLENGKLLGGGSSPGPAARIWS